MVEHQQGMLPSYILCPAAKTSDKESSFNLRARILIGYFSSAKIAWRVDLEVPKLLTEQYCHELILLHLALQ